MQRWFRGGGRQRILLFVCAVGALLLLAPVAPSAAQTTPITVGGITPVPTASVTATPNLLPPDGMFMATLKGQPLVDALQRGGYVIYFRHASTDQSHQDVNVDLANCDTQRNLSDQGRADMSKVGQGFQMLNIPVGKVIAGEYCRTRETAMLAFGRTSVDSALTLNNEDRAAYFRLLTTAPIPGTNTVLVGHVPGISAAVGLSLNEGEAGIFDPSDRDNPKFVARVLPTEWAILPTQGS